MRLASLEAGLANLGGAILASALVACERLAQAASHEAATIPHGTVRD